MSLSNWEAFAPMIWKDNKAQDKAQLDTKRTEGPKNKGGGDGDDDGKTKTTEEITWQSR